MPDGAQLKIEGQDALYKEYDAALADLDAAKNRWVRLSPAERIALLAGMKDGIMKVARGWAEESARKKGLIPGTPVAGGLFFLKDVDIQVEFVGAEGAPHPSMLLYQEGLSARFDRVPDVD